MKKPVYLLIKGDGKLLNQPGALRGSQQGGSEMPELIELIKQYGAASYNAGVYEREPEYNEKRIIMDKLFENIRWLLEKNES